MAYRVVGGAFLRLGPTGLEGIRFAHPLLMSTVYVLTLFNAWVVLLISTSTPDRYSSFPARSAMIEAWLDTRQP